MTQTELIETAKYYCDYADYYRLMYVGDVRFGRLDIALNELPMAYNLYAQAVVGTPTLQSTRAPLSPYVAAAIGTSVAGVAGGVVAGLGAQIKMEKFQNNVKEFQNNYAKVTNNAEKMIFLINEIDRIVDKSKPEIELLGDEEKALYSSIISRILEVPLEDTFLEILNFTKEKIEELKDTVALEKEYDLCLKRIEQKKEYNYGYAQRFMEHHTLFSDRKALAVLEELGDYKESKEYKETINERIRKEEIGAWIGKHDVALLVGIICIIVFVLFILASLNN